MTYIFTALGMWLCPEISGQPPKPCSQCKFCTIGADRAVLLGGVGKGWKCLPLDTVKILDMSSAVWVR